MPARFSCIHMDEQFIIRDGRKRGRYSVDHALFAEKYRPQKPNKTWAALIKPTGVTIYNAIIHHADYHTQDCYPSYTTLEEITGMSLSQVKREVKKLNDFKFIHTITPEDKKSLPAIPEKEKDVNTYIVLDKSEWVVPENYETDYAPTIRTDKGKPNPKRSKNKKRSVPDRHGEVVSDRHGGVVSDRHGEVVSDRHGEVVSDRHGTSVCQTRELVSDRHPNKDQLNNTQLTLPNTTTKSGQKEQIEHGQNNIQKDGGDGVDDEINSIFSQKGRQEKITAGHIKRILSEHHLKSEDEIVRVVRFLAAQNFTFAGQPIGNMLGFLIGSKNDNGGHASSCFFDGECVFPEPEPAPEPTEYAQEIKQQSETNWQAKFDALSEEEQAAIRAQAEKKIVSHKANMKPDVYAETLKLAACSVFQEWSRSNAARTERRN